MFGILFSVNLKIILSYVFTGASVAIIAERSSSDDRNRSVFTEAIISELSAV